MITTEAMMKLQNGSDVRGVAIAGVPGEDVTLVPEAVNRIAAGFAKFLAKKLNKQTSDLRIAVGHDSRVSAGMMNAAASSVRASTSRTAAWLRRRPCSCPLFLKIPTWMAPS